MTQTNKPKNHGLLVEAAQALEDFGSQMAAAKFLGIGRTTLRDRVKQYEALLAKGEIQRAKPLRGGRIDIFKKESAELPPEGEVWRYIFTSAQNNTPVHPKLWKNLTALARHYDSEDRLFVATYTYNKNAYRSSLSVKRGQSVGQQEEAWYDERVEPHIKDHSFEVAPGLIFCGELNILPTAVNPLSGYKSYTGRKSSIIPHAKFAMQSVATNKHDAAKLMFTTGTVTQRNYIKKNAGFKAEFHHGYGALIVEVDSDGRWFVRQLNATDDGTIYDLELRVKDGRVKKGKWVEAINWGDIHVAQIDPQVKEMCWGKSGILDTLKPKYQFLHDTLDFKARNHHDRRNCHINFDKFVRGKESVEDELAETRDFLEHSKRKWCKSVVVDSNHDNALGRWLMEADYKTDHVNALFFLEAQHRKYRAIADQDTNFHLVEWVMQRLNCDPGIEFLREDQSFMICESYGGIECGHHGHLGPNGVRGGPSNLKDIGSKLNTGHTHSAGIYNGLYVAGTCSLLDMGYNRGPSSWSHSMIVTYENGKRTIVTLWQGKWRG